jgi:hypothetical protein
MACIQGKTRLQRVMVGGPRKRSLLEKLGIYVGLLDCQGETNEGTARANRLGFLDLGAKCRNNG